MFEICQASGPGLRNNEQSLDTTAGCGVEMLIVALSPRSVNLTSSRFAGRIPMLES